MKKPHSLTTKVPFLNVQVKAARKDRRNAAAWRIVKRFGGSNPNMRKKIVKPKSKGGKSGRKMGFKYKFDVSFAVAFLVLDFSLVWGVLGE